MESINWLSRIKAMDYMGDNNRAPGQRRLVTKSPVRNSHQVESSPSKIRTFVDIMHLAKYITSPTPELATKYGLKTFNEDPNPSAASSRQKRHKVLETIQHNFRVSLEQQLKGNFELRDYFEERLYQLMMIRHGYDPHDPCQHELFKNQLDEASQTAQQLRQNTANMLSHYIKDPRLFRLTELQEIAKHGYLITLLRRAFLDDTEEKTRAEVIQMLALQDAALRVIKHRKEYDGTLDRVCEVIDYLTDYNPNEKVGGTSARFLFALHNKLSLATHLVEESKDNIVAWLRSNRDQASNYFVVMHSFPSREIEHKGKKIRLMFTSRFKNNVSALMKYLQKEGRETPRDMNGLKFIVSSPEEAVLLIEKIFQDLSNAGFKPTVNTTKEYTNYFFDAAEIKYNVQQEDGIPKEVIVNLPKTTSPVENPASSWNLTQSQLFQCDLEIEVNGQRRKVELRIVSPKHHLMDEFYTEDNHEEYVNKKMWANKTTLEQIQAGYAHENTYSRIFSLYFLSILDAIDRSHPVKDRIPKRRILNLANPAVAALLAQKIKADIAKKLRRQLTQQKIRVHL